MPAVILFFFNILSIFHSKLEKKNYFSIAKVYTQHKLGSIILQNNFRNMYV